MQRWTNGIECLEWSEWYRSTMQYAYSLAWIPDPACVRLSSPPVLYRQTWFVQLWLWHVLLLGTIAALALANTWQKSMQLTACFKQRRIWRRISEPTLKTSKMGDCHGFIGWEGTLKCITWKRYSFAQLSWSANKFHIKAFLRQVRCQYLVWVRLAWAPQCRALDATFSPPPRQKYQKIPINLL
jgi:hypothetical protein